MTCNQEKTTKIIIPRASGEGGLGLPEVAWGAAYFNSGQFSNIYVKDDIYLKGDMFIWGEVNTVNSTVLTVKDTNIVIGDAGSGNNSDVLADGGGFTLKGNTDKSILWRLSNDSWNFSDSVKISGSSLVDGSSVIEGDNYTVSDSYIGGDFSVTGSSLTKGSSIIEGSSVIEGDNYTVSDSYIGGDFSVTGSSLTKGSSIIEGTSVIEGDNYTVSDSYIGGDFSVTGSSLTKGSSIIEGTSVVEGDNYTVSDSYIGGDFYVTGDSIINGDLTVNGESFVVEATTVKIEDKNLEIGISSTGVETDTTADGGGITLHGDTPKTILWSNATDSWDLSENVGVADGKFIFSDKLRARDSAGLSLEDDGGNGIFIEDGGDVGIGTTSPSVGLEINHTDAVKIPKGTSLQRPTSTGATHKGYIRYNTTTDQFEGFGAGNAWGSLGGVVDVDQDTYISAENSAGSDNDQLKFFTIGTQKAVIDSNGNVGIGSSSPTHKLHINAASNNSSAALFIDAKTRSDTVDLVKIDGGIASNNSNVFTIKSDGNVGIGSVNPGEKLDVNGRIYIGNSSAPGATTNRLYSVGGILYWDGENVLHSRDTIGEMEDTSIGTKSNGQVLIWNATSSKWVNNALTGGNGIDVTNAAGGITISHSDTSSAASSNNSGRTYIQDIGLDTYGHVTSLATRTHSNAAITLTAGSGMSGGGSFDLDQSSAETITISHSDTSSQATSNNSGRTYIQDIGLDTYGHVTSLSTATETVVNTNTTYTAGNGLGLTGTVFSVSSDLIGKVHSIGDSSSNKIVTAVNSISFTAGNALRAKLLSSGTLHVSGDVLAFSSTISDERLKDNATEIKGALNKIEAMRGVSYTWNKGSRKGQKDIGVIAQEVEQVIPEIVREYKFEVGEFEGDETKYKTVDYEKLSAVLIEAIKELSAKVKTLEKTISDTQV
jgi:hypothetical protein